MTIINSIDAMNVSPQSYLIGYEPVVRVTVPDAAGPFTAGDTLITKLGTLNTSHIVIMECAIFADLRLHTSDVMTAYQSGGNYVTGSIIQPKKCPVRILDGGTMALMSSVKEVSNGVEVSYLDRANSDYISDMRNLAPPGYKNELTLYNCDFYDTPYYNHLMRIDNEYDDTAKTSLPVTVQLPIPTLMDEVLGFPTYKSAEPYEIHIKLAPNNVVFKAYNPGLRMPTVFGPEEAIIPAVDGATASLAYHIGSWTGKNTGVDFVPTSGRETVTHSYSLDNVRFVAYCLKTDNRGVRDQLPLVIWADVTAMQMHNSNGNQNENWTISWQFSNVSKMKILPSFSKIDLTQTAYAYDGGDALNGIAANSDYYELGMNPIGSRNGTAAIAHYKISVFGKTFPYEGGCGNEDISTYNARNHPEMFREFQRYYGKWDFSGDRYVWAMTMGNESAYLGRTFRAWLGKNPDQSSTDNFVLTDTCGAGDQLLSNPDAAVPLWDKYGKFLYAGIVSRLRYPEVEGFTAGAGTNEAYTKGPVTDKKKRHIGASMHAGIGGYFGIYHNFNVLGESQHAMAQGLSAARLPIQVFIKRTAKPTTGESLQYLHYVTSRRRYVLSEGGTNLDI